MLAAFVAGDPKSQNQRLRERPPRDDVREGRLLAERFRPPPVFLLTVAQPIRAAVTGQATSPPIFGVLAVLGREESLIRLKAHAE